MARPRNPKWGGLLLESVARKGMTLLEVVNSPARNQRVLVACPHHPEGRSILVRDVIKSKHCCHAGNAQSPQGRAQRAATFTEIWDDPERRVPCLRSASGHKGAETTKLYICKVLASDNTPVLKFGRSERGAKRFGKHLVETIWEMECPTEKAKLVELYGHLRFSAHSLEVELNTSGYTECYKPTLPVKEVIDFFEKSL